jgi:hypothetical protein
MLLAAALAALCIAGGAFSTLAFDDDAGILFRLSAGACLGLASLGLLGFIFGSMLGLTPLAIGLATAVVASPLAFLARSHARTRLQSAIAGSLANLRGMLELRLSRKALLLIGYLTLLVLLTLVFRRAMFYHKGHLYTGVLNNYGDLPFHLDIITRFAYGNNLPPEDPTFAGVRFTYPFISDLVAAIFVKAGASMQGALLLENLILAFALVGLIAEFSFQVTRDRIASLLSTALVLFNGGLGWILLAPDIRKTSTGIGRLIMNLPHDYTVIPGTTWRWGNCITSLLVTQRSMLMGLPLALVVFVTLWKALGISGIPPDRASAQQEGRDQEGALPSESRIDAERPSSDDAGAELQGSERTPNEIGSAPAAAPHTIDSSTALVVPPDSVAAYDNVMSPDDPEQPARAGSRQSVTSPSEAGPSTNMVSAKMIGAGVAAGLLPLVHVHSFLVVMAVAGWLCLIFRPWRMWLPFLAMAFVIGLPQIWWLYAAATTHYDSFFGVHIGWDRAGMNPVLFWLNNTGAFIPLLILAVSWPGRRALISKSLLLFYVPFLLCFAAPNVFKFAPWIWDNIKILFFWYLASCPLVAIVLMRWWRGGLLLKAAALVLTLSMTLAGALDVWRVVSSGSEYGELNKDQIALAGLIRESTPLNALVLHAAIHNNPVVLTGRRSLMGYPGHLWSHGISPGKRESEIKAIYSGAAGAIRLINLYNIDYAVVGPEERAVMAVNDGFFSQFPEVGSAGDYHLYKLR